MCYWALIAVMICAAVPAPGSNARPFATAAKFSVDDRLIERGGNHRAPQRAYEIPLG